LFAIAKPASPVLLKTDIRDCDPSVGDWIVYKIAIGIILGIVAVYAMQAWMASDDPWKASEDAMPPGIKQAYDAAGIQAKKDAAGSLGRAANDTCKRRMGISEKVETAKDIITFGYGSEKAVAFAECVVNEMYPVPRAAK
jgi:hypothetical protein